MTGMDPSEYAIGLSSSGFIPFAALAVAFLCGIIVCATVVAIAGGRRKRERTQRIQELERALERASLAIDPGLLPSSDDELSRLQDEISKSIGALRHARARAETTRERHAANLANIAHQSKTPVTIISLAIQRLKPARTLEHERAINTVEEQLAALSRLNRELLLCARMDSGALDVKPSEQDAFTLLSGVADGLEELSRATGVTIEVADEQPVVLFVDPHWMHEALSNVVKNCLEHAPAGSTVRISCAASPLFQEISVEDDGPGMAPERLAHLFDRFNHAGRSGAENKTDATGLGLSFARDLIELQGGSIRAANKPEGGARFTIRLNGEDLGHPGVTFSS